MVEQTDTFCLSCDDLNLRLDKLLAVKYPFQSRTYFQSLIEDGYVLINGEKSKKRIKPQEGDEIEVCFVLEPLPSLEPENIALNILYEDAHLLAVSKPRGMVVHPAPGHYQHTFVHALLYHCQNLPHSENTLRPGIVHRLDKDTSGILLAAKTKEAHQKLITLFSERQIQKTYLAFCQGSPGNRLISAPIKRHPVKRQMMTVDERGKEAISIFKVLETQKELSLVAVQLITGRTHQIRVHLQHLNTPLLGDALYGSPSLNQKHSLKQQLLHAWKVEFLHPITQQKVFLEAPIPEDMASFAEKKGFRLLLDNLSEDIESYLSIQSRHNRL